MSHVGIPRLIGRRGEVLSQLWLVAFACSRGSWARVSVGSLCVVLRETRQSDCERLAHTRQTFHNQTFLNKQANRDWENLPTAGILRIVFKREPSLNWGKHYWSGCRRCFSRVGIDSQPAPNTDRIRSRVEDFDVSSVQGVIAVFTSAEKDFMETKGNAEDNFQKNPLVI